MTKLSCSWSTIWI